MAVGLLEGSWGALQHVCWELWGGVWLEPVMCQRFQSMYSPSIKEKVHHGDPRKPTALEGEM